MPTIQSRKANLKKTVASLVGREEAQVPRLRVAPAHRVRDHETEVIAIEKCRRALRDCR